MGLLIIFAYHAFYRSDPTAFPMTLQGDRQLHMDTAGVFSYVRLVGLGRRHFGGITSGSISYSLCRPVDLYAMWYTKSLSGRISKVALRAVPILVVRLLLAAAIT